MLKEMITRVLGVGGPKYSLNLGPLSFSELSMPSLLAFPLLGPAGAPATPSVKRDDTVSPGMFLGHDGVRPVVVCPVKGKVAGVVSGPHPQGGAAVETVLVEPEEGVSPSAFHELDPETAGPDAIIERVGQAGVLSGEDGRLLSDRLLHARERSVSAVVVNALDQDLDQCSTVQLFRERSRDAFRAALMLAKAAGAGKALVAAAKPVAGQLRSPESGVELLSVPPVYPESLSPLLLSRARLERALAIPLKAALFALDAVEKGVVPDKTAVTFIGPGGKAEGNYLVPVGMRLSDFLAARGLSPRDQDKVLMGGPMRGWAQYTLEAAITQNVSAVTFIPREALKPWSDDPCVNFGGCVSACPLKLQPQLIARYAEFGLFDRTEELKVLNCIECGLCAAECPVRRPLLQWIRLAKQEVRKRQAMMKAGETAACEEPGEAVEAESAAS